MERDLISWGTIFLKFFQIQGGRKSGNSGSSLTLHNFFDYRKAWFMFMKKVTEKFLLEDEVPFHKSSHKLH